MRTIAAVALIAALTAGCGSATGGDDASRPASAPSSKAAEPAGSQRSPKFSPGPPDAYLETPAGRVKLTTGTFCWTETSDDGTGTGMCVDMLPPGARDIAEVPVVAGDRVTLHLGFTPREPIHIAVGRKSRTLPAADTVSWIVEETGLLNVSMYAPQGDVSYDARLVAP